jgi:hypothetical protein
VSGSKTATWALLPELLLLVELPLEAAELLLLLLLFDEPQAATTRATMATSPTPSTARSFDFFTSYSSICVIAIALLLWCDGLRRWSVGSPPGRRDDAA